MTKTQIEQTISDVKKVFHNYKYRNSSHIFFLITKEECIEHYPGLKLNDFKVNLKDKDLQDLSKESFWKFVNISITHGNKQEAVEINEQVEIVDLLIKMAEILNKEFHKDIDDGIKDGWVDDVYRGKYLLFYLKSKQVKHEKE